MKLSVAHTFDPELIPRLSHIPAVKEMYGKLDGDVIGGGRSGTLRGHRVYHIQDRGAELPHGPSCQACGGICTAVV
ncbi:MAG: hypothetical protein JW913_20020 [Chitinispirillaceae bacterium]|nr:hypothetical protein [Chitinispirillaceae bacterium]